MLLFHFIFYFSSCVVFKEKNYIHVRSIIIVIIIAQRFDLVRQQKSMYASSSERERARERSYISE